MAGTYRSEYTGAQIDASVAFGHNPDSTPTANSVRGVTSGGVKAAIDAEKVQVDDTLTIQGAAADAKVTGDAIGEANNAIQKTYIDDIHWQPLTLNLFDKTTVLSGYYIDYLSGNIGTGADYFVSDFIEVEEGILYRIDGTNNQQGCYYNDKKEYVSGFENANTFATNVIPSGVHYIRFTGIVANLNTTSVYKGRSMTLLRDGFNDLYYTYEKGNIADKMRSDLIDVTKTVTNVTELYSIIATLQNKPDYVHASIYLAEGRYTLTYPGLISYGLDTYGLVLPDNVDLIGLGNGAIVTLDLTGRSSAVQSAVSTINFSRTHRIENITFTATNCRYAAHVDNGNGTKNSILLVKNCRFIHYGNNDAGWAYPCAVGEGTSSGNDVLYENCEFNSVDRAYYLHNNTGFEKASVHEFKNCRFISSNANVSFQVEGMGSGVKDTIKLYGCTFNALFDGRKNNSASASVNGNDFIVYGYGNSNIPENWYFADGSTNLIKTENVTESINATGATVDVRTPVKCVNGQYIPMTNGDDISKFFGIVRFTANANHIMQILTGGYLPCNNLSKVVGTKIGVVNGALAVVTTDDYIGIVKYYNSVNDRAYMAF